MDTSKLIITVKKFYIDMHNKEEEYMLSCWWSDLILYRWLLDTIVKNYTNLNNRVKQSQNFVQCEKIQESESITSNTPSRISVHSNPFKPIKDLLATKVINKHLLFKIVCEKIILKIYEFCITCH